MNNKEVSETMSLAIQVSIFAMLCVFLVILTNASRNMYNIKDERDALKKYMETESDKYLFQHAEHVYGTDIIAFIIKYDATFDYYITLSNGKRYSITKDYAKSLRENGKDGNIIWSQEFLTNTVFLDNVYNEFSVEVSVDASGDTIYYVTQK